MTKFRFRKLAKQVIAYHFGVAKHKIKLDVSRINQESTTVLYTNYLFKNTKYEIIYNPVETLKKWKINKIENNKEIYAFSEDIGACYLEFINMLQKQFIAEKRKEYEAKKEH